MVCRMTHTHIKKEDWSVIARMLRAGYTGVEIARTLGKDPSAVKGKYRRRRGTKAREDVREQAKKRRIDERPAIVEHRSRLGDWEGDTMMLFAAESRSFSLTFFPSRPIPAKYSKNILDRVVVRFSSIRCSVLIV